MKTMKTMKYAYICPRGFANEYRIWKCDANDAHAVAELQAEIDARCADANPCGDAYWIEPSPNQKRQAIDWLDRRFA